MACLQAHEVRLHRHRRWSHESCAARDRSRWPCRPLDRRRQRERVACWPSEPGCVGSTILRPMDRVASESPQFLNFESKPQLRPRCKMQTTIEELWAMSFSRLASDRGDGWKHILACG